MTHRILPRDEWHRLADTELGPAVPFLRLVPGLIEVVEYDGRIVGCWATPLYLHCEGLWIHPDHRKRGRVGWYLLAGMRDMARQRGYDRVLTATTDDAVRALLERVGATRLLGEHYVLPLSGSSSSGGSTQT